MEKDGKKRRISDFALKESLCVCSVCGTGLDDNSPDEFMPNDPNKEDQDIRCLDCLDPSLSERMDNVVKNILDL